MVLSTDDPGNTGSSLSSAGVREGLFDVCWRKDKWEPVVLLYLLTMFLCFWRCTTSATTSVIATSPVWRAKCLQISSWMNGREGPNLTWRILPAPVPAYQSRWDSLLRLYVPPSGDATAFTFSSCDLSGVHWQNASWLREPDECATTPLGTPGTCGLPSLSTADNCSDTGMCTDG